MMQRRPSNFLICINKMAFKVPFRQLLNTKIYGSRMEDSTQSIDIK